MSSGSRITQGESGPAARLRDQYLELLKRSLIDDLGASTMRAVPQPDDSVVIEAVPEAERSERLIGRDWPAHGLTMVGLERLTNVQRCIERLLADGVPGDLIETGVWRGGVTIFMRAMLDVHGETDRLVWAADSFAGLPRPDADAYPADRDDRHHTVDFLAVPLEAVQASFARYGVATDSVRFLRGWFRDTLPGLREQRWSLLRLDGDMYESTMVALSCLYDELSSGGFVLIDDYGAVAGCRLAVDEFRQSRGIQSPLETVDWTGVYWRKD